MILFFLIFIAVNNPEESGNLGYFYNFGKSKILEKIKISENMASKYEKIAECYEKAAQDARHRAVEAQKTKEKKQAKEQKKRRETSCKVHRDKSKDNEDIPETGATNATFYPVYQQVMSSLHA